MNHPSCIHVGYTPVVLCHTAHVACKMIRFIHKMEKRTGKILEENPKSVKQGESVLAELVPMKPLCLENFEEYPPLGRFAIRDMKKTVAVGVVKEIVRK